MATAKVVKKAIDREKFFGHIGEVVKEESWAVLLRFDNFGQVAWFSKSEIETVEDDG